MLNPVSPLNTGSGAGVDQDARDAATAATAAAGQALEELVLMRGVQDLTPQTAPQSILPGVVTRVFVPALALSGFVLPDDGGPGHYVLDVRHVDGLALSSSPVFGDTVIEGVQSTSGTLASGGVYLVTAHPGAGFMGGPRITARRLDAVALTAALSGRIDVIEDAIGDLSAGVGPDLQARQAAAAAQNTANAAAAAANALTDTVSELAESLAALTVTVGGVTQTAADALAAASAPGVDPVARADALAALAQQPRIAALEVTVAGVQQTAAQALALASDPDTDAVARADALAALQLALAAASSAVDLTARAGVQRLTQFGRQTGPGVMPATDLNLLILTTNSVTFSAVTAGSIPDSGYLAVLPLQDTVMTVASAQDMGAFSLRTFSGAAFPPGAPINITAGMLFFLTRSGNEVRLNPAINVDDAILLGMLRNRGVFVGPPTTIVPGGYYHWQAALFPSSLRPAIAGVTHRARLRNTANQNVSGGLGFVVTVDGVNVPNMTSITVPPGEWEVWWSQNGVSVMAAGGQPTALTFPSSNGQFP